MSAGFAPGKINAILYPPDYADSIIELHTLDNGQNAILVQLDTLSASDVIVATLKALAERAVRIWPQWYGIEWFIDTSPLSLDNQMLSFLAVLELSRRNRAIEPAWLKKAIPLAAAGKPPLIFRIAGEIQARQLALVLIKSIDTIVLVVPPRGSGQQDCSAFPRAVEWLARESGIDVRVLLPSTMAWSDAMSPLLYNAKTAGKKMAPLQADAAECILSSPSVPQPACSPAPRIPDEEAPEVERVIGKPHPRSKGEQLLAKRLSDDARLAGLFRHNQEVIVECGRRFIVDLLWPEGKVIVEVDGYYYHSNIVDFANDRDRDYRLLVSGYRVLRLTHEEVIRDTELAVEKIRDVVHFLSE